MLNNLKRAQDLGQKNPNFGSKAPANGDKNPSERRSAVMQSTMDRYSKKYPEALKQFDKEAASGKVKFGKDQSKGRAQDVATHKHPKGWSDASAKDIKDRDITTDTAHAGPAARASKHPVKKDKDVHRLDTRKPVSTPSGPAVVTSRVTQQNPERQNQSPGPSTGNQSSFKDFNQRVLQVQAANARRRATMGFGNKAVADRHNNAG